MVNASMPSCAPDHRARRVDDRARAAVRCDSPRNAERPPLVMKHTSMLSCLSAVRRPSRARGAHLGLRHLADREPGAVDLAPPSM